MKILIADKFPDGGRTELVHAGFEVAYDPELKDDSLAAAIASPYHPGAVRVPTLGDSTTYVQDERMDSTKQPDEP